MSTDPQSVDLAKPESRYEATKARENDKEIVFPTWKNHLLCDKDRNYPAELNNWERAVVESESKREGFKFWYRNPDRPTQDSLGIAYVDGDETKIVRPDFIFIVELQNGSFVIDIVDPHSIHLADALPKLCGLARYAESHHQSYRRIEALAEVGGKLRVLDMTRADVRQAVLHAPNAKSLYECALANDYG